MFPHRAEQTSHHYPHFVMATHERHSIRLLLEGAVLFMSILLIWALSAQIITPLWSILSLINFLWLSLFLFRIAPISTILALPFLITRSSVVVALILIEFGENIPELAMFGTAGTYTASFIFYTALLLTTYTFFFNVIYKASGFFQPNSLTRFFDSWANLIATAIIGLISLIMLALIIRGLISGFPLLAGIDRFAYRRLAADAITLNALNFKFVLACMLGFVVFCAPAAMRLLRTIAAIQAGLLLILYFLFGEKFFTQLAAMAAFFAPYLMLNHAAVRRNLLGYGLGGLLALTTVFSVTWWIYSGGGSSSTAVTIEKLSGRIVGQGQLWYLQSRIGVPMLNWDSHLVSANLQALSVKEMEPFAQRESIGPAYFSNKYAPDIMRASLNRNRGTVTYTMAAEALGLAAFGWIGLGLMMIFCGLILSIGPLLIARAITQRLPLSIVFGAYVFTQTYITLNQGSPWVLFSIFSLKWFSVIAFVELCIILLFMSQANKPARHRYRSHNIQRRRP